MSRMAGVQETAVNNFLSLTIFTGLGIGHRRVAASALVVDDAFQHGRICHAAGTVKFAAHLGPPEWIPRGIGHHARRPVGFDRDILAVLVGQTVMAHRAVGRTGKVLGSKSRIARRCRRQQETQGVGLGRHGKAPADATDRERDAGCGGVTG